MYTGTEVFNMAISVIDEITSNGTILDSQVKEYKNRAPYLLDMWQHEWANSVEPIEDLVKFTVLTQELQVSENNCIAGAYYLAEHFALADQNKDLADIAKEKYRELKREGRKPLDPQDIIDVY